MKVKFIVDNGANIHSAREDSWDLNDPKDAECFGYTKDEWIAMSEDEKYKVLEEWANHHIEFYFEEL